MSTAALSRRTFLSGTLLGGAGGVLATTGVHAITHAFTGHDTPHVDIGFCTDMTAHHVQALVMCERVLGRDTGDAVQAAATEVLRNQAIEVGMMRAWLADWDASTAPPTTVMAWMDMSATEPSAMDMSDTAGIPIADMPGYASDEDLGALSKAEGLDRGRLWLELMRAHHVGGVTMASAAVVLASSDKVIRLARTQAEVQAFEISQYDLLLRTTYAASA